jgi:hypothetical protein
MFQLVWVRRVANSIDRQKIDFASSRRGSLETRRLVSGALSRSRKITTVPCDSEASPVSHTSWRPLALAVRAFGQERLAIWQISTFSAVKTSSEDLKTEVMWVFAYEVEIDIPAFIQPLMRTIAHGGRIECEPVPQDRLPRSHAAGPDTLASAGIETQSVIDRDIVLHEPRRTSA